MKLFMLLSPKLPSIANSFLLNITGCENFSTNKYENANFLFISRENFMLSMKKKSFISKVALLFFACVLSVILGLFALPFGVIGRLWSVIVSVPGHPLLLDSSCKLFPCQILFSKKNKKEKKCFNIYFIC